MTGEFSYRFEVTCLGCGGPLRPLASGDPERFGARQVASVECAGCGASWLLTVVMSPIGAARRAAVEHGTERGYQQHRARRDPACLDCLGAHNAHTAVQKRASRRDMAAVVVS